MNEKLSIDQSELFIPGNDREKNFRKKTEIFDYEKYFKVLQDGIKILGVTTEDLSRSKKSERKFSPESWKLYERLEMLIEDEWGKFTKEFEEGEIKNEQLKKYDDEAEAYDNLPKTYEHLGVTSGLRTFDAMRCFEDKIRTLKFLDSIKDRVIKGENVLEAGAGTGILAIAAARAGAGQVDTIEINPVTAAFAKRVIARCENENIDENSDEKILQPGQVNIILGDALEYKSELDQKYDAYISENIYTGQLNELQQQINNYLLQFVNTEKGKIIPCGIFNGLELTCMKKAVAEKVAGKEAYVPDDIADITIDDQSTVMTEPTIYDEIDFDVVEPLGFRNRYVKTVSQDGYIDCITIFSLVQFSKEKGDFLGRNETKFLNNDLCLLLEKPLDVANGDEIEVFISYNGGDSPEHAIISCKNLRTKETVRNKRMAPEFDEKDLTSEVFKDFNAEKYINYYYKDIKIESDEDKRVLQKAISIINGVSSKNIDINETDPRKIKKINVKEVMEATGLESVIVENLSIFNFQKEVLKRLLCDYPKDNIKTLDVGGGPTVYQHIFNSFEAGTIIHSEFVQKNIDEVKKWLDGEENCHNWDSYFETALLMMKDDTELHDLLENNHKNSDPAVRAHVKSILDFINNGDLEEIKNNLRKKIGNNVVKANVFKENLDMPNEQFEMISSGREGSTDFITSNFNIESATDNWFKWEKGINNVVAKLKPGGYLSMTAIKKAEFYKVGDKKMPALKIDEINIEEILQRCGLEIVNMEVLGTCDRGEEDYEGMVFVLAKKK
jgi:predicted RNA methylase